MVTATTEAVFWDLLNVEKQNEFDLLEEENGEALVFYTPLSLRDDLIIVSVIVALASLCYGTIFSKKKTLFQTR